MGIDVMRTRARVVLLKLVLLFSLVALVFGVLAVISLVW